MVHLVGHEGTPNFGSEVKLKLEHFALSATGLSAFEEKLISSQIQYRKTDVPGARMVQIHVADPDGNHIHIDFDEPSKWLALEIVGTQNQALAD